MNNRIQGIVFLITVFTIFENCSESSSEAENRIAEPAHEIIAGTIGAKLDSFLTKMSQKGFSGTALVAKDDKVILKKGYGLANRELGLSNTNQTLFNIASVSKIFTAAAILHLEMRGKLQTDDLITKYLGLFPGGKSKATIHHLLTHTAGLVIRGTALNYESRAAFVESMKHATIESMPGEKYRYTNAGYTLLAAIVEEVSGLPFETYLSENIFLPSGLTLTGYVWDRKFDGIPIAIGYEGDSPATLKPVPRETDVWGSRGPEGILTTVGDLYQWIIALRDGKVLSDQARQKMFTAYVGDEGYGWHVLETKQGKFARRGGGLPEFESELQWYLDQDTVVAFTINNHIGFRRPVSQGIRSMLF